jgi:hypothetical protein
MTEADKEKTEPDPGMMQSVGEHQEVPKEEATVMPARGKRKRHTDRNLAAEHRQKPKERARGCCGSQKTVTVADRRMAHCAGVAWLRRGAFRKNCTTAKVERATRRARPLRKNLRTHHKGTKDRLAQE